MKRLEVVTSFKILMMLASEVGKAKKVGNKAKITEATLKLEEYKELIKMSDKTMLHLTVGDLRC